nr:IS200/IS605 family transposase [Desulfobulbus propionicus]
MVWIPKCRRKMLYGQLRKNLGDVFHDLARQKESRIVEGHLQLDHVHMLLSIPPKYSVAQVVGYMKGKSAIYIARNYLGKKKNYNGMHFWARGYFVSTVGADEAMVRAYIRNQEQEDQRVEQLNLFKGILKFSLASPGTIHRQFYSQRPCSSGF